MKKSKLVVLLATFTSTEWNRFKEFVSAPYFNKNKAATLLFEYMYASRGNIKNVNKTEACSFINNILAFNSSQLAYTMSDLLSLAEQFIAVEKFISDNIQRQTTALKVYSDRNLQKHYRFLYRSLEEDVRKRKYSLETLSADYQINEVALFHFSKKKIRKFDPSIKKSYEAFNSFNYLQLLKSIISILGWQGVVSGDLSVSPVSIATIEALLEKFDDQSPLVKMYLIIYQLYDAENPESASRFDKLMSLIDEYKDQIESEEMREISLAVINFGVRKIRRGSIEYLTPVLKTYEESIEAGYLFENGHLSHWTYTNVVRLGLQNNQYQWTEQFIHKYKDLLTPEFVDDAFHLNLADLMFNSKKYDEVLEHLLQLNSSDPMYYLASRIILIKTFYEQENIESLLSALASFSVYLKRNKSTSIAYKKTCLNFCNLLNQVLRNNQKKRNAIKEKIQHTQPLAERAWLLKVWEDQD